MKYLPKPPVALPQALVFPMKHSMTVSNEEAVCKGQTGIAAAPAWLLESSLHFTGSCLSFKFFYKALEHPLESKASL